MVNILRYRVVHSGVAGTPYLTTHYAIAPLSTPAAFRAAVANFWDSTGAQRFQDLISTGDTVVDELRSEDGMLVNSTGVADFTAVGTTNTEMLPPANQGLLRLETGSIILGKRIRGKMYLPAPLEGSNVLGVTSGAYRTAYENAWNTSLNVPNCVPAVWARKSGEAVPVNTVNVWQQWSVLRSRRD